MSSHKETVELKLERRTAWITLDRPPLNILDIAMMEALGKAVEKALAKCDFLVFQGAGTKAFSAGADAADHTLKRVGKMLAAFHDIFRLLVESDCIKIAAVHGYCLGGGMELASLCDFVLATESAQFGQPEIKLGCFPPVAMITLPQLIGMRAAAHLILTGHQISATEAHRLGLVTRVVDDYELPAAVDALLEELRALSPAVLKLTGGTLRRFHGGDFETQLKDVERVYLSELMRTKDAQEGIRAFLKKHEPVWKGK
jgi:cyclohexa-1,5-dienecarbonyl-CoA hydratase